MHPGREIMLQRVKYFLLFLSTMFILVTGIFLFDRRYCLQKLKESSYTYIYSQKKDFEKNCRNSAESISFLIWSVSNQAADSLLLSRLTRHSIKQFLDIHTECTQISLIDTNGIKLFRFPSNNTSDFTALPGNANDKTGIPVKTLNSREILLTTSSKASSEGSYTVLSYWAPLFAIDGKLIAQLKLDFTTTQLQTPKQVKEFKRDLYQVFLFNNQSNLIKSEHKSSPAKFYWPNISEAEWSVINQSNEGVLGNSGYILQYLTLFGNKESQAIVLKNGATLVMHSPLKLFAYTPTNQLEMQLLRKYAVIYSLFAILSLFLAHLFDKMHERILIAKEKLHQSHTLLERQNRELQKSNKTKNTFFSIISHDLRNPIQVVMGYTGMLIENYHNMSIEEVKEYFKDIESATEKLLKLLENLLNWSRTQTGDIHIHPATASVAKVIETACQPTHMGAKRKNIALNITIPQECNAFIDRNLIMTVIRNLVTNAIKFTPDGGLVSVTAQDIDTDSIIIKVEDTGTGMSKKECQHLFSVEENFSKRGTAGETGTGLGLILSKEFIDKSRGTIRVISSLDKGSSFILTLPKTQASFENFSLTSITSN